MAEMDGRCDTLSLRREQREQGLPLEAVDAHRSLIRRLVAARRILPGAALQRRLRRLFRKLQHPACIRGGLRSRL